MRLSIPQASNPFFKINAENIPSQSKSEAIAAIRFLLCTTISTACSISFRSHGELMLSYDAFRYSSKSFSVLTPRFIIHRTATGDTPNLSPMPRKSPRFVCNIHRFFTLFPFLFLFISARNPSSLSFLLITPCCRKRAIQVTSRPKRDTQKMAPFPSRSKASRSQELPRFPPAQPALLPPAQYLSFSNKYKNI